MKRKKFIRAVSTLALISMLTPIDFPVYAAQPSDDTNKISESNTNIEEMLKIPEPAIIDNSEQIKEKLDIKNLNDKTEENKIIDSKLLNEQEEIEDDTTGLLVLGIEIDINNVEFDYSGIDILHNKNFEAEEKEEENNTKSYETQDEIIETEENSDDTSEKKQETTETVETTQEETQETEHVNVLSHVDQSETLIDISNPDENYVGTVVELAPEDRDLLEHLVMGEAGAEGFEGAALVAQAIRDAITYKGFSSVAEVRKALSYSGSVTKEPNEDTMKAVSYIFDDGGCAVKHKIFYFYSYKKVKSNWHESQQFVAEVGNHRFFSSWA